MSRKIFDVSLKIYPGMLTYPGDPLFRETIFKSLSKGDAVNLSEYTIGSHMGTHIDLPAHFFKNGRSLKDIPLERFLCPAQVIEIPSSIAEISASVLQPYQPFKASCVFFKTKNSSDEYIGSKNFKENFCCLDGSAARLLIENKILMAGIDYLSIEKYKSSTHDVHTALLANDVIIVEGLDLRSASAGVYEMICLPLNLPEANGAPSRILLLRE